MLNYTNTLYLCLARSLSLRSIIIANATLARIFVRIVRWIKYKHMYVIIRWSSLTWYRNGTQGHLTGFHSQSCMWSGLTGSLWRQKKEEGKRGCIPDNSIPDVGQALLCNQSGKSCLSKIGLYSHQIGCRAGGTIIPPNLWIVALQRMRENWVRMRLLKNLRRLLSAITLNYAVNVAMFYVLCSMF